MIDNIFPILFYITIATLGFVLYLPFRPLLRRLWNTWLQDYYREKKQLKTVPMAYEIYDSKGRKIRKGVA